MKKFLSILLSVLMMISVINGFNLSAYADVIITSGDYKYIVLPDGSVEIIECDLWADIGRIPSEIDDYIVTSIGDDAFNSCRNTNFTEIIIPNTVKSIGKCAFACCINVLAVTIPESVISIGDYAFMECDSMERIDVDDNNPCYSSEDGILYNKEKTELIFYPECNTKTSYIIPNSVTSIANCAFYNCYNLKSITLHDDITYIGDSAFYGCSKLTDISIPDGITSIGDFAFKECRRLNSIVIPRSVTSMGTNVFYLCIDLTDVLYLGSEKEWNQINKSENLFPHSKTAVVHFFDGVISKQPTCKENGTIIYQSETYLKEIIKEIPIIDHVGVVVKGNLATCIKTGLTDGLNCSMCGEIIEKQEIIPLTEHTIVTDATVPATCISTGLTEGSHCSVCGEVFVEQESIPMIPHKYISSLVQAAADSQGYTKYICSVCGDTYNADYFDAATVYSDIAGAKAGEIVKVPIYIRDNNGLMGWKLTFDYDTDVLTPISVENGEIINNGYLDNNIDGNMKPGSINVYWAGDDNNSDNGIMFYINFAVNEDTVGKTNVDVSFSKNDTFDVEYNDVYLNCEPIVLNIENDKYTQSAKITAGCDNITAGDDLELKLNISELQNVSAANITISYDSNVFDFKSVNSISGIFTNNTVSNGKVILDVSGINNNADNKDFVTVLFKCKDNAASGNYNFNVTANETGIICKGCTVSVSSSATSELVKVYADDVNAKAGDTITIPIMIDNNHGIMGYGLDFSYDTNMLEIVSATRGTAFSGNFNDSIGVDDGKFIVLWNGTEDNLTNGVLLNLTFRILSNEITDAVINMTYSQDDTFNENWEDVVFDCKSINVKLNSHQHNYTEDVTSPTCTEKGYTTYTCSCGDSYVDDYVDAVGHSFGEYVSNNDATYESNGTKTAVCSRCGAKDTVVDEGSKLVKEPDLSSFVIKTVSLTLQSSIKMNFKVLKSALADFENPYMVFKCEGLADMIVTEYIEQGDYYVFSFPGISPKMMNNKVTAQLYGTYKENGKVYSSETKSISVKEYAYKMLDAYASINTTQAKKLKTLIVDLLNYGAQAQIYTKYKTNSLVNADLTDVQKAWGTAVTPELTNITNKEYKTIANPTAQWNAAGLVLNDSVKLRAKFTVNNIDNITVKITCAGNIYIYSKDDFTKNSDGSYYVYCNEIKANQMSKEILMTVYDNGVQCSNTMRFSVESYAKGIQDSAYAGTALDNLTQAMMRYGKSAEAYGN